MHLPQHKSNTLKDYQPQSIQLLYYTEYYISLPTMCKHNTES